VTVGIVSYGSYVPSFRIGMEALAEQWAVPPSLERMYRLNGRSVMAVAGGDEDVVTMAIEAGERALRRSPPQLAKPQSLLVGSESHPYAVKPTSVIVSEALDLEMERFAVDLEFACRGGSAAMMLSAAFVSAKQASSAIAIGADCPQSSPGSLLEGSVGAGAAAFVLAEGAGIASIEATAFASSDVTDFWRRDTATYPSVSGKFSADVGYRELTTEVVRRLLKATGASPGDFRYVCFHQPYQSLPLAVARECGFDRKQVLPGLVSGKIGNTYSSACLLALCAVLDSADPGDRILFASYGSGAGSDGFVLAMTSEVLAYRERTASAGGDPVATQVGEAHATRLTYGQYSLAQGKLHR